MNKINIVGISGSTRTNSYNTSILKFIKESISSNINFEILDISKLPMFNEDIEEPTPEEVALFRSKLILADGFVIVTPEHNYSIPALLKNALDWASRGDENVLENKYVAILSASPGLLGGARAQYQLRQICVALNLVPINRPEVFISRVNEKINHDGVITDDKTKELILELVNALMQKIDK